MKPSTYQAAIFDWIANGSGHAVAEAVPGSGKTTTGVEGAKFIPAGKRAKFLAFNKHSANDLKAKLPRSIQSGTIHSTALGSFFKGGTHPDERKYGAIVRALADDMPLYRGLTKEDRSAFVKSVRSLVNVARLTLTITNPTARLTSEAQMWDLADHFGILIDYPDVQFALVRQALQRGLDVYETEVDFTDLLWIPEVLNLKSRYVYDFLLVDEAQDLNAAQLAMVLRIMAPGGRVLAVGDGFQAIYGFAGASCDSMQQIRTKLSATTLPLSICYRCPAAHVRMAANLNPQIEARPDAPEGNVFRIQEMNLHRYVKPGSLVLCRTTAPLVENCLNLIKNRIRAKVRGRDIGEQLTTLLMAIAEQPGFRMSEYKGFSEAYLRARIEQLHSMKGDVDSKAQAIGDQVETLDVIHEMTVPTSLDMFTAAIDQLFSDEEPDVWLSTIHRAKGLEAESVFILRPGQMPMSMAKADWEQTQEMNLLYVAATRSMSDLYIVKSPKDAGGSVLEDWARLAKVQVEDLDAKDQPVQAPVNSDVPVAQQMGDDLKKELSVVMGRYQGKATPAEAAAALADLAQAVDKAIRVLTPQSVL